jgi:hypothetical protein
MVFLGGHATKYKQHQLMCVQRACVCAGGGTALSGIDIEVHLGNKVIVYPLSPLTSKATAFLQCGKDHVKSLRVGDCPRGSGVEPL